MSANFHSEYKKICDQICELQKKKKEIEATYEANCKDCKHYMGKHMNERYIQCGYCMKPFEVTESSVDDTNVFFYGLRHHLGKMPQVKKYYYVGTTTEVCQLV